MGQILEVNAVEMGTSTAFPQNISLHFGMCLIPSFRMEMKQSQWAGTGTVDLFNSRQFPVLQAARRCQVSFQHLGYSKWNELSLFPLQQNHLSRRARTRHSFTSTHRTLCWHLSHHLTQLMNNGTSQNLQNNLQDKYTSCPNWLSCL